MEINFSKRTSVKEVEEGNSLSPKFSNDGFIPVVTTDADSGVLLMHAIVLSIVLLEIQRI